MVGAGAFQLGEDIGDVNRFAARFRAAASFRGLILENYSADTAGGYSALCKVFFVWSAFESFLRVIGVAQRDLGPLLEHHGGHEALAKIRELDTNANFYDFIYERVNHKHQVELDSYRNNDLCNLTYLASAVRHIFAHGVLTPNANKVEPVVCVQICECLSSFLLHFMDREFGNRMANYLEENYGGN